MNSSGITATAEVGLRLVVPDRAAVPLVARLDYTASDPYAIKVAFHTGEEDPVEWIFARELLTVGIVRPAGEGDVQVWPGTGEDEGDRMINISLSSPFGQAQFDAPVSPLAEFLHKTYEIVPAGQEAEYVDLDTEIEQHLQS